MTHTPAQTTPKVPLPRGPHVSSQTLDTLSLTPRQRAYGWIRFLLCSTIAIVVFFVSITVHGESQIVFGLLYTTLMKACGSFGLWLLVLIIGTNLALLAYVRLVDRGRRHPKLYARYKTEGGVFIALETLGFVYVCLYTLDKTVPGLHMPDIVVGPLTGESVIPPIVLGVLFIIVVGAIFMPMLLDYGAIECVGALLEPLMRPLFKLPGKAALDATASFLSSSSLGVLITSRLYTRRVYTEKEAVAIATGFSAVSVGFAYLVITTAGMETMFFPIYIISFALTFILAAIMVRLPPIVHKRDVYIDGTVQTHAERIQDARLNHHVVKRGLHRAVARGATADPVVKSVITSLRDSAIVIPKVLAMLAAVSVTAMIVAHHTPIFTWLGVVFEPLLKLLHVPAPSAIAPSLPIGIAEMFLPVLMIAHRIDQIPEATRFFLCIVSMVQIIFFSETGTVMVATKLPVKVHELVLIFLMRTLIAMPLAALAMHLVYG